MRGCWPIPKAEFFLGVRAMANSAPILARGWGLSMIGLAYLKVLLPLGCRVPWMDMAAEAFRGA